MPNQLLQYGGEEQSVKDKLEEVNLMVFFACFAALRDMAFLTQRERDWSGKRGGLTRS